MSRFRVSEKALRSVNDDSEQNEAEEAMAWIKRCITNLTVEINNMEAHDENKRMRKTREQQATVYKNHLEKFEMIKSGLMEGILTREDLEDPRIQIDDFIEQIKNGYAELDFDVYGNIEQIIEAGGHMESENEPEVIVDEKAKKAQEEATFILQKELEQKMAQEKLIKERKEKEEQIRREKEELIRREREERERKEAEERRKREEEEDRRRKAEL